MNNNPNSKFIKNGCHSAISHFNPVSDAVNHISCHNRHPNGFINVAPKLTTHIAPSFISIRLFFHHFPPINHAVTPNPTNHPPCKFAHITKNTGSSHFHLFHHFSSVSHLTQIAKNNQSSTWGLTPARATNTVAANITPNGAHLRELFGIATTNTPVASVAKIVASPAIPVIGYVMPITTSVNQPWSTHGKLGIV